MSLSHGVTAEDFARHVKNTNPFTQDRVTQAESTLADVPSIHEKAFRKLVRRIEEVRSTGSTTGIMLTGPAGVGKSHTLARVFRWAATEGKATVVYLHNILSSPERTARYLLHATVNELAGNRPANFAQSKLYELINLAVGARLGRGKGMAPTLSVRREVLESIGHEIDPDQLVMPVFIAYLEHAMGANLAVDDAERRAFASVRWLSGETIDPDVAQSLGLRINCDEGACILDDVAVQRTFDVICGLCAQAKRPFVLCLDQVDNLPDDRIRALTAFVHAAIDNGHNLVAVTSGVRDSMTRLERDAVIPQAALDRIAQHRINLEYVSPRDARQIVVKRLDRFCESYKKLKKVASAREKDPLAPLSEVWWSKIAERHIEFRPRDVVRAARDAWEDVQDELAVLGTEQWLKTLGKAEKKPNKEPRPETLAPLEERIDQLVSLKITEAANARKLNPARLPPDGDNLATLTLTLLQVCQGASDYTLQGVQRVPKTAKATCYDLWVSERAPGGEEVTNGLTFFTADNPWSATSAMKRLQADDPPPTHQILVTDEERRPIRFGAKGLEIYENLLQSPRFEHIKLSFNDHAQLDAVSSVLSAARIGDLDIEVSDGYRAISEQECRESLHRRGVFLEHPLLRHLLTEDEPTPSRIVNLPDEQSEQIRAQIKGELALALSMTGREMATIILSRTSLSDEKFDPIWQKVKTVANQMHQSSELFVDAVDDDLFLQLA